MSPSLTISMFDWLWVLARGLLLLLGLRAVAYVVGLSPLRSRSRAWLDRYGPLATLMVCLGYLVLSLQELFGAHATLIPVVLALFLAACAIALWGPIRDLLTGVFLRAGGVLQIGDELTVGELRGQVERLFGRRVLLRTKKGEALVPYSHLSRSTLLRTRGRRGRAAYTFRVRQVAGLSQSALRKHILESALLCHWSSPSRAPELVNGDNGAIDVTIFAVSKDMAPEVEGAVRAHLAAVEQTRADEVLTHTAPVALPYEVAEEFKRGAQ